MERFRVYVVIKRITLEVSMTSTKREIIACFEFALINSETRRRNKGENKYKSDEKIWD